MTLTSILETLEEDKVSQVPEQRPVIVGKKGIELGILATRTIIIPNTTYCTVQYMSPTPRQIGSGYFMRNSAV